MRKLFFNPTMQFCALSKTTQKIFAVVGGGPSGLYSAKKILGDNPEARVHVFEGLPFPFGLVRYGVAPDHQSIKNITKDLTEVLKNPRLSFFGNVNIGKDIEVQELENLYSGVLYAYGATEDKKLQIEGEQTKNVLSGREFINWYNGSPGFNELAVDFSKVRNVIIIGNGNVALDVARVLAKSKSGQLDATDISATALSQLKKNEIQNIYIVGRRGHIQSQFSMKEFRAFTQTPGTNFLVSKDEMSRSLSGNSQFEYSEKIPSTNRQVKVNKRRLDLLQTMRAIENQSDIPVQTTSNISVNIHLKALLTPLRIHSKDGELSSMEFSKNILKGEPFEQKAITDSSLGTESIPADLIIRCIGYESTNIAPNYLPWNAKNSTLSNHNGCILEAAQSSNIQIGKYAAGWVKTGAVGVLDQTMIGCIETINNIDNHLSKDALKSVSDPINKVKEMLQERGVRIVTASDWDRLDAIEIERGRQASKIREKITSISEALELLS